GGPGVAAGYLRRPEFTAEKFIANPFVNQDFAGPTDDPILYRSGDAVEIDAKLGDVEGVANAAVVLRGDNGIEQLVAFIVPGRGAVLETRAMRSALRTRLPAYMIPSRFETVESLPK